MRRRMPGSTTARRSRSRSSPRARPEKAGAGRSSSPWRMAIRAAVADAQPAEPPARPSQRHLRRRSRRKSGRPRRHLGSVRTGGQSVRPLGQWRPVVDRGHPGADRLRRRRRRGRQSQSRPQLRRACNELAASDLPRRLRLANFGGLVVVDLIGKRHDGERLRQLLLATLAGEAAQAIIAPIGKFGTPGIRGHGAPNRCMAPSIRCAPPYI